MISRKHRLPVSAQEAENVGSAVRLNFPYIEKVLNQIAAQVERLGLRPAFGSPLGAINTMERPVPVGTEGDVGEEPDKPGGGGLEGSGTSWHLARFTGDGRELEDSNVTDDDQTVTVEKSLVVQGPTPWADVTAFGAVGDGSTDNTAAFQNAIDSVSANGGVVFVPPATNHYLLTGSLTFPDAKHVTLRGAGWHNRSQGLFGDLSQWGSNAWVMGSVLRWTAAVTGLVMDNPVSLREQINIEDVALIGPGSGTTYGLYQGAGNQNNHVLGRNVLIANWYHGIHYTSSEDNVWYSLEVFGCQTGIYYDPAGAQTNNYYYNLDLQANAVAMEGAGSLQRVYGGLVQANTVGIRLNGPVEMWTIDGVWFEGNSGGGLQIDASLANIAQVRIANCRSGDSYTLAPTVGVATAIAHLTFDNSQFAGMTLALPVGVYNVNLLNSKFAAVTGTEGVLGYNSLNSYPVADGGAGSPPATTVFGAVSPDWRDGEVQKYALTGDATFALPTHAPVGARVTYIILQDGVGGHSANWNAGYGAQWSDNGNTANKLSSVTFIQHSSGLWTQVGAQTPYAQAWGGLANPSGLIGLTAVNGGSAYGTRADSTHALSQAIAPTWTAAHTWQPAADAAGVLAVKQSAGTAVFSVDTTAPQLNLAGKFSAQSLGSTAATDAAILKNSVATTLLQMIDDGRLVIPGRLDVGSTDAADTALVTRGRTDNNSFYLKGYDHNGVLRLAGGNGGILEQFSLQPALKLTSNVDAPWSGAYLQLTRAKTGDTATWYLGMGLSVDSSKLELADGAGSAMTVDKTTHATRLYGATTVPSLTIGTLAGVLKGTVGAVSGGATINDLAAQTADYSAASHKFTNLTDPASSQDAATKAYVDAMSVGLTVHPAVACATTANITLSGEQTLDGVLTSASRVLVKNQTASAEDGIYVSAAGAWSRAADMDTAAETTKTQYVFVSAGTTQVATSWVQTATVTTLGTDPETWVQFAAPEALIAGGGLTKIGSAFAVGAGTGITVNADDVQISASYTGQSSITTLGTVGAGTWQGSTVGVGYGGTGLASYAVGDLLYASAATTLARLATGTATQVLHAGVTPSWSAVVNADLPTGIDAAKIADGSVSNTEFQYINSLTGNAQTQLNGKMVNPMSSVGSIIYGEAAGAPAALAGNSTTTREFLLSQGTGAVAQAPYWATLTAADVGLSSAITGSGTLGWLPVFNGSASLADSAVSQDASNVFINGHTLVAYTGISAAGVDIGVGNTSYLNVLGGTGLAKIGVTGTDLNGSLNISTPGTGHINLLTSSLQINSTPGVTKTFTYKDGAGANQTITVTNGIITAVTGS